AIADLGHHRWLRPKSLNGKPAGDVTTLPRLLNLASQHWWRDARVISAAAQVCSDGVCFKTRRITISRTCRLAERVASRPPTVAVHFGGLRRNDTTASARERNDGTREGDRIRRDGLSRPPRRPAFARVRIFDTSRGIRNAPQPFFPTFGSASRRSMPTSMMIAQLPLPWRLSRAS